MYPLFPPQSNSFSMAALDEEVDIDVTTTGEEEKERAALDPAVVLAAWFANPDLAVPVPEVLAHIDAAETETQDALVHAFATGVMSNEVSPEVAAARLQAFINLATYCQEQLLTRVMGVLLLGPGQPAISKVGCLFHVVRALGDGANMSDATTTAIISVAAATGTLCAFWRQLFGFHAGDPWEGFLYRALATSSPSMLEAYGGDELAIIDGFVAFFDAVDDRASRSARLIRELFIGVFEVSSAHRGVAWAVYAGATKHGIAMPYIAPRLGDPGDAASLFGAFAVADSLRVEDVLWLANKQLIVDRPVSWRHIWLRVVLSGATRIGRWLNASGHAARPWDNGCELALLLLDGRLPAKQARFSMHTVFHPNVRPFADVQAEGGLGIAEVASAMAKVRTREGKTAVSRTYGAAVGAYLAEFFAVEPSRATLGALNQVCHEALLDIKHVSKLKD